VTNKKWLTIYINKKCLIHPAKKANVGDIVLLEEKAFVVSDKKIDSLELRKRALDENINNLKCYKRIEEEEDAIAEYLFTRTVQPKSIDTLMIQSSTFFQGKNNVSG
jgi:hypothetical protein